MGQQKKVVTVDYLLLVGQQKKVVTVDYLLYMIGLTDFPGASILWIIYF